MSRRPLLPGAAHNQVARSRMAPGGQVKPFSQSPIPRAGGVRRVRQTGAAPTGPGFTDIYVQQGAPRTSNGGVFELNYGDPLAAGQVAVAVVGSINAAITPPAGWTTLVAGDVGRLHYWVGYVVATGADDWTTTISPAYNPTTWATSYDGYTDAMVLVFESTPLLPIVDADPVASTTTLDLAAPPGAGPWTAHVATRAAFSTAQTVASSWPPDLNRMPDILELGRGAVDGGSTLAPIATPGTVTWPYAVDAISLAMGWAP